VESHGQVEPKCDRRGVSRVELILPLMDGPGTGNIDSLVSGLVFKRKVYFSWDPLGSEVFPASAEPSRHSCQGRQGGLHAMVSNVPPLMMEQTNVGEGVNSAIERPGLL
jgi:hypothetical protein